MAARQWYRVGRVIHQRRSHQRRLRLERGLAGCNWSAGWAALVGASLDAQVGGGSWPGERNPRFTFLHIRVGRKTGLPVNDLLAAVYLICFAAIGGGAFALMTQNLRGSNDQSSVQLSPRRRRVHPEAPEPGEELLYADFSRERLERMYQQNP